MPVLLQLCITAGLRQTFYSQTVMEQCRHIFTEILEQENASWLHPAAFDPALTFNVLHILKAHCKISPSTCLPQPTYGNLFSMNKRRLWCTLTQGWTLAVFLSPHTMDTYEHCGSGCWQPGPGGRTCTYHQHNLGTLWRESCAEELGKPPLLTQLLPTAWKLHTHESALASPWISRAFKNIILI